MKVPLLLGFCFAWSTSAFGQMTIGHHYKIHTSRIIKHKSVSGDVTTVTSKRIAPKYGLRRFFQGNNLKAGVAPTDKPGILKINFWSIKAASDPFSGQTRFVNSADATDTFYLEINPSPTLAQAQWYISLPFAVTEIGAVTIPFKYYFGGPGIPNNVVTDVNAGAYIGRKWGRSRFYRDKEKNHESFSLTAAGVVGLSKIEINDETVKSENWTSNPVASNELGLSIGLAAMSSYKGFSIALIGGMDVPLSKEGRRWMYAHRPWLGIGFGYKLNMLGSK